jgi:hypothetical protein
MNTAMFIARGSGIIVARPGAVILVPLPDIALERGLGVNLVLVHVKLFAEHLLDRSDQPRVVTQ